MPDTIADIAGRHGFSTDAVRVVAEALRQGGGRMAQFNHPELGGAGQWIAGGMIMIGDMFNHALKARVDALCRDLAAVPGPVAAPHPVAAAAELEPAPHGWWPRELGNPSVSGAQNDMRYAYFHDKRRLAVQQGGNTRVYDTGEHRITGLAQQQGDSRTATFTSRSGPVGLQDLKPV